MPIFLATLAVRQRSGTIVFPSAAAVLDTFGMHQDGSQYRRLVGAFQRVFGATIFFGTEVQRERARVIDESRFNFMTEAHNWYSRSPRRFRGMLEQRLRTIKAIWPERPADIDGAGELCVTVRPSGNSRQPTALTDSVRCALQSKCAGDQKFEVCRRLPAPPTVDRMCDQFV